MNTNSNRLAIGVLILFIFILIIGVIVVVTGDDNEAYTPTNFQVVNPPEPQDLPVSDPIVLQDIIVSNITPTSATISWITERESASNVKFGENATATNQTGEKLKTGKITLHYAELKNLKPSTNYFYTFEGAGETLINAEAKNFRTLAQSDAIGIPKPLLISLPSGFKEGIIVATASDGNSVSRPVSVYATSANASIDIGALDKTVSGSDFTSQSKGTKIFSISSDNKRYIQDFNLTGNRITISEGSLTSAAYNPGSPFTPSNSSSVAMNNNQQTSNTNTNTQTPTQPSTQEPQQEPIESEDILGMETGGIAPSSGQELPDTAFGDDLLADASLILGIITLTLGYSLYRNSRGGRSYR